MPRINVYASIDEVLRDVLSCAQVISSSLHGLIVSDAFNVPSRRIVISGNIRSNLKFADYIPRMVSTNRHHSRGRQ